MSFKSKIIFAIILTVFLSTIPFSIYILVDGRKSLSEHAIDEGKLYSQIISRETLNILLMNGGDIETSRVDAREMLIIFEPLVKRGLYYSELILLSADANKNGLLLAKFPDDFQNKNNNFDKLGQEELTRLEAIRNYNISQCPGIKEDQVPDRCYEFVSFMGLSGRKPVTLSHLYISESEILKPLERIEKIILFGSIIVIFIMSVAGFILGRHFLIPIQSLIKGVKKIDSGDLDTLVPVVSNDEMGVLAQSFNRMAINLQSKIYELNKEINIRKKAQEDLQDYRDNLEVIVKQRTADLLQEINAHKETGKELIKAKESAEKANKAKSNFVSNMSHEIRTPMNAILGFTEILDGIITDEIQKEYVKSISSSGKILLNLINDVLDLAKVESGKLELELKEVNLNYTIHEMLNIFRRKAEEKSLELIADIDSELPQEIRIDDTRMRQILLNLIGNAIKFTEDGFIRVFVQIKNKPINNNKNIHLVIGVEDSGIGIPEDQQKMIFESFMQVKGQDPNKYGGTGLGLAITKNLVMLMGGSIHVESIPGKGSTFFLDFPNVEISENVNQHKETADYDPEQIIFEKGKVLVADDIIGNQDLIRAFLSNSKLDLIFARDGLEALNMIEKEKPDLVLMDVKMPIMSGLEAVKKLKANPDKDIRNIPVIMTTASVWKESLQQINESVDSFISKPFKKSALFNAIARYMPHQVLPQAKVEDQKVVTLENKTTSNKISSEKRKKWTALLETLDRYKDTRWKNLRDFHVMNEIEIFVKDLNQLGLEYEYPMLVNWAAVLNKHVSLYDSDAITQMIEKFPDILVDLGKELQSKRQDKHI